MSTKLPKGWERLELGEVVTLKSGGTPNRATAAFWGGEMPWISAKDLKFFDLMNSIEHLTPKGAAELNTVPAGTILILVRGMGLLKDFPIGLTSREMAFNQDVKALVPKLKTNARFLAHALVAMRSAVMGRVDRAGHGTGRLPTDYLIALPIAFPPLAEQRRIVSVLDTWDRAIDATDSLIAAKRKYINAAVKRLVWSDRDDWQPLSAYMEPSSDRVGDGRALEVFSVTRDGLKPQLEHFNKRIANEDIARHMLLQPGELVLSGLNFWLGSVAVSDLKRDVCISPDYKVFRFKETANPDYFRHLVRTDNFRKLLISCSTERASIVRRNFNRGLFLESEIPVPPVSEQATRARALDAIARELQVIEERYILLLSQKRGLMQKLLTGEWRLDQRFDPPVSSTHSRELV